MTEDSDSCNSSQQLLDNFVKLLSIADYSNNEASMLEPDKSAQQNKNPIEKPSVYDLNLNNFQCHVPLRISEILEIDHTEIENNMKIRSSGLHIKSNNLTILSNRDLDQRVTLNFCCHYVPRVNSYIEVIGDLEFKGKPIINVYSWNYLKEIQCRKMNFLVHNIKYHVQYHNMQLKRSAEVRRELRKQNMRKNEALDKSKIMEKHKNHLLEISDKDQLKPLDEDQVDLFDGNGSKILDKVRLEHLDEVRSKILEEIRSELLDKVRSQHLDKVRSQQLGIIQSQHLDVNQVCDKVPSRVSNVVRSQILEKVSAEILDKNRSQILKEGHAKILDEIRSELLDEIISEMDEISAEILDNDRTVVWDKVPSEISDEIQLEISDEIRSVHNRSKFLDKLPSKVSDKSQSEMLVANQLEILHEIRSHIGNESLSGSFNEVRSAILDKIPSKISDKGRMQTLNGNQLNILNKVGDPISDEIGDEILSGSSDDVKSEILDKNQFDILNKTRLVIEDEILSGTSEDVRSEILDEILSETSDDQPTLADKVSMEIMDEKILKQTKIFENDISDDEINKTQYLNEKYIDQIKKGETPVKCQMLIENSTASDEIIELCSDDEEKTCTVAMVGHLNKFHEKLKHEKLKTSNVKYGQRVTSPNSIKPNKTKNFVPNSPEKRSNQFEFEKPSPNIKTRKLRKNLGIPYRQKRKSVNKSFSEEEDLKDSGTKKRSEKPRFDKINRRVSKDLNVELEISDTKKCTTKPRFDRNINPFRVSKDFNVEFGNDSKTPKCAIKTPFENNINPRVSKGVKVVIENNSEIVKRPQKPVFDCNINPRALKDHNVDNDKNLHSKGQKCLRKSQFSDKFQPTVLENCNVQAELAIIDLTEDDKNTSMIIDDSRKSLDRKASRYSDIDLFEEASFSKQNFIVDSSDISIKSADVSADLFDDD